MIHWGEDSAPGQHQLAGRPAPKINGRHLCPFCARIEAGDYQDHGQHVVGFVPLAPVTEGHYLFVPRVHVEHAAQNPEVFAQVAAEAAAWAALLPSYNLITSGGPASTQTVPHLHLHVVPRRPGDGLVLPWTGQQAVAAAMGRVADLRPCTETVRAILRAYGVADADRYHLTTQPPEATP